MRRVQEINVDEAGGDDGGVVGDEDGEVEGDEGGPAE